MVSAPDVQTIFKIHRKGREVKDLVVLYRLDVLCVLCAFAVDVYSVSR
jgi:hypothetical protein